jgi:anti-sigma B factor antagonist
VIVTNHTRFDGSLVLTLAGELDMAAVSEVRETGLDLITGGGCRRFLVETGEVSFIDSCGLSALIAFRNATDALGISFALVDPSVRVVKVLALTGLSGIFTIERTGT